jgi:hypothetical protein
MFGNVRRFFQKIIRGWDDSETWNLDHSFYKWFYTRLKRYIEVIKNTTEQNTTNDLKERLKQLELLIEYYDCEYEFPHIERYMSEDGDKDGCIISMKAYKSCQKDFHKWFIDNIDSLCW